MKLSGIFEKFYDVEKVPLEDLERWLKTRIETHTLENFLGNRLLYPQTVPLTKEEMEIDLSILREALKRLDKNFYEPTAKKVAIPEEFLLRFQPKEQLVVSFIDGLSLKGVNQLFLIKKEGRKLAGSVINPNTLYKNPIQVTINNQKYKLAPNSVSCLNFMDVHLVVSIENSQAFQASGGELGVYFDLRKK